MYDAKYMKEFIERNSDVIKAGKWGDYISDQRLQEAEHALGFPLPPTYKWFLKHFGGADIAGNDIYAIFDQDFETVLGYDIVGMYLRHRNKNMNPDGGPFDAMHLEFINDEGDDVYYFDRRHVDANGEYQVHRFFEGRFGFYADNFFEFLVNKVEFFRGS